MRRRAAGVAAIKNKNLAQSRYKDKGSELASEQLTQLSSQLESFKGGLEEFAAKHKDDIKRDPLFRQQFQEMCAAIGVDPLASSKGFWAEMLGVGDFYYELGVQIIEVCLATNHRNGGIMYLDELKTRLVAANKSRQSITLNDLLIAIKKLKVLGNGFTVVPIGGRHLVQSVPGELTMDHTTVLQQAEGTCFVTKSGLISKLNWGEERAKKALDYMVKEGIAWVDEQASPETEYWFPGLFSETTLNKQG